jgi:hypothetical protein
MPHLSALLVAASVSSACWAVDLREATKKAFADYVQRIEAEMAADAAAQRAAVLPRVPELQSRWNQKGVVAIPFAGRKPGDEASIDVPDGLINHWFGAVFVPKASVADVRSVLQDYNNYSRIYAPDVTESKLLGRKNDEFQVFLRLHRDLRVKLLVVYSFPAEFNATYNVRYSMTDGMLRLRSISTRIAQVRDPEQSHTDEFPIDAGDGYLWRLYSYWRIYEGSLAGKSGVYIESEAVSLSRSVPRFVAKVVTYFTSNFPQESLESTLAKTRAAVAARLAGGSLNANPNHRGCCLEQVQKSLSNTVEPLPPAVDDSEGAIKRGVLERDSG